MLVCGFASERSISDVAAALIGICRVAHVMKVHQNEKNRLADLRNSVINESLQGIRTLKLYGWEEAPEQ